MKADHFHHHRRAMCQLTAFVIIREELLIEVVNESDYDFVYPYAHQMRSPCNGSRRKWIVGDAGMMS